jgi:hypothetical protein
MEAGVAMVEMDQPFKEGQIRARVAFGRLLRLWRERNGWTQYTVERWGKEAGFATISSGNVSMVEQGKAGDLRAQAHFQLADVNRRLADQHWGPLRSPDLQALLSQAVPITGDDGAPWGPVEFWSCYVGLLPVPSAYQSAPAAPAPILTAMEAAELSADWRQQVSSEAAGRGLDPIDTLQGMARQAPAAQRKTLRAVLAGFRDYRPDELLALWDGGWLPQRWIQAWKNGLPPLEQRGAVAGSQPDGQSASRGDQGPWTEAQTASEGKADYKASASARTDEEPGPRLSSSNRKEASSSRQRSAARAKSSRARQGQSPSVPM